MVIFYFKEECSCLHLNNSFSNNDDDDDILSKS